MMKSIFKNIGPIREAELELKDLTIIAGPNNTGKTYLAYTLYGFFKMARERFFLHNFPEKLLPFDPQQAAKALIASGTVQYSVDNFEDIAKTIIKRTFKMSAETISDIFSSPPEAFKGSEFSLEPDRLAMSKSRLESTSTLQVESAQVGSIMARKSQVNASYEKSLLYFQLPKNKRFPQIFENISQEAKELVAKDMLLSSFMDLCVPRFTKPFILTAERFGISLFYKELDFSKNRLVETLQKLKDKGDIKDIRRRFLFLMDEASARYAQPIKDNIDYTRDLESVQTKRSPLFEHNLFDGIQEMLDGSFKQQNGEIRFISQTDKQDDFDIPLHLASSSARGLSDLFFYLRHVAEENQLLIIDEPESHLNTANQIVMARLLARCVNSGLKVLITTHSDFIIKEFNNLIMLSNEFEGKADFLNANRQYSEKDHLRPEAVRAYDCKNGTALPCEVDHKGMVIPSFEETIDEINRVADELDFLTDPILAE